MPGAGFKTFTAGEVFTATDANTYLMQQAVMVFTNEAARDAAITSPSEGMHAYLTAPTVPAATGGVTYLPSGITTIYNGSVWVCMTPVCSYTTNSGTVATTSYTATLSGSPGTNPSVTLVTGTTALISFNLRVSNTTGGAQNLVSVAVSGAGTVAAQDDWGVKYDGTSETTVSITTLIPGLTAGTNTFTLNYRCTGTMTASVRRLTVSGIA